MVHIIINNIFNNTFPKSRRHLPSKRIFSFFIAFFYPFLSFLNQNIALSSSIFFIIRLDDVTRINPITDCNNPAADDIPMSLFIFNDLYTNVLITFVYGEQCA